jgi:hypothetical protein
MRLLNDDFDENGILKDGHSVRVPMIVRDDAQIGRRVPMRGLMANATPSGRLHDGGGAAEGHRPGFVVSNDAAARDARAGAYAAYERDLTSAWRRGSVSDVQARDPRGREAGTGETKREADVESCDVLPLRDGVALDEARRVHGQRMVREYLDYDDRIAQQWRNR